MKIAGALRAATVVLLVFGLVWFAVVLHWQVAGASPTAVDLGMFLLVLPLVLLGVIWLLRRTLRRRSEQRSAASVAVPVTDTTSLIDDSPRPDRIVHVLASATLLRAGSSAAAVAESLAAPERPPLHGQLKDSVGLPVFAAAVENLDPGSMELLLGAAMAGPDTFERVFGDEALRAIALLDPVAEELLHCALPPIPLEAAVAGIETGLHPHAMHHSLSSRGAVPAPAASVLRVHLLLPAAWPSAARQASGDWLSAKARAIGFDDHQLRVDVVPVNAAADTWRLLDQLMQTHPGGADGDRHLMLAAHSSIGETSIDRLDARRELLVSGHPEGLIPGEGAAGLLLGAATASLDPAAPPPLRLHRLLRGQAGHGRTASRQAAELLRHALNTAAHPADAIALVFSDADHRPSRAIEIAGAISATLPDLDPVDDARHLGLVCGDIGAVAPLALLAAAAAQSAQDDAPVLVFGLADPLLRIATTVSPLSPATVDRAAGYPNSAEAATAVTANA